MWTRLQQVSLQLWPSPPLTPDKLVQPLVPWDRLLVLLVLVLPPLQLAVVDTKLLLPLQQQPAGLENLQDPKLPLLFQPAQEILLLHPVFAQKTMLLLQLPAWEKLLQQLWQQAQDENQ